MNSLFAVSSDELLEPESHYTSLYKHLSYSIELRHATNNAINEKLY